MPSYVRQPAEVITWRLELNDDGVHYDVWRVTGTGAGGTPQWLAFCARKC